MNDYYIQKLKSKIDSIIDINCLYCNEISTDIGISECLCEPIYDMLCSVRDEFCIEYGIAFDDMDMDLICGIWKDLRKEQLTIIGE